MDKHSVASIVFINTQGLLIFQQRENKPGIRNPGLITAWGGAVEDGETTLAAAVREIKEETSLQPTEADLEFLGTYPRDYQVGGKQVVNHVFLLRNIDETKLQVYEGEGYVLIDPSEDTGSPKYTDLTKEIIADLAK